MQFMLTPEVPPLRRPITYTDNILLIGSCFTEHISDRLHQHRFNVLSNPHGILFNPLSVADSLNGYMDGKVYREDDLFYLNELWNSWDHHTRFSHTDKEAALAGINASQAASSGFIKKADLIIVTLGSAYQYYLKASGRHVANNHRAPAQWFEKRLLPTDEIIFSLDDTLQRLFQLNPFARVIFTISPVRHIRDGVVNNNRGKARLIEAVHTLCDRHEKAYYFPAYELIIDVLRDYRFYDIDMVHPNFPATSFVWEHFIKGCIDPSIHDVMRQVHEISIARAHRSRFPDTEAHKKFRESYVDKSRALMERYPFLDLNEDIAWFTNGEE